VQILKTLADAVIDEILIKNKLPTDPEKWVAANKDQMKQAFLQLGDLIFKDEALPKEYMNHYVNGHGAKSFNTIDLLSQDRGARDRVYPEVIRRVLEINTKREQDLLKHATPVYPKAIDPIITVKQINYDTMKWWGALGTFNIEFTPVGTRSEGTEIVVCLHGTDTYRWSKERSGLSEKIHLLGLKLSALGMASEFPVIGNRCTVFVNVINKLIVLEGGVQSNPTNGWKQVVRAADNFTYQNPKAVFDGIVKTVSGLAN
jgi:hypothetical protein